MNQKQIEEYILLSSIPIRNIDKNGMPKSLASACIIKYKEKHILLTVQHATGNMENWVIELKYEPAKGISVKPLGGMYFIKSIDINTCEVKDIDFSYVEIPVDIESFSQEIDAKNGSIINEKKRLISTIDFDIIPDKNELYGFFGQIMPEIAGKSLIAQIRTYTGFKYIGDEDDYYVFEIPFDHPGHEYFRGCSGAPIIDTKGNIIALVCRGDIPTNRLYGISIKKYEVAINTTYA